MAAPISSKVRVVALFVGTALSVAACAEPDKGYPDDPGACSVVTDQSIVEQLGREAVDGPNTAKIGDTDSTRTSTCEWSSIQPPNLGQPASAEITVTVRVSLTEEGDPDPRGSEEKYRSNARSDESSDGRADTVGDQSRNSFTLGPTEPGTPSAGQVATVDFRRANAYVTVEYRAWGSNGFTKAYLRQDAQAQAARNIAREVLNQLGEPR